MSQPGLVLLAGGCVCVCVWMWVWVLGRGAATNRALNHQQQRSRLDQRRRAR
ncbi:hypothetical protein CERZMDRAFT_115512 [Cercospora zeae-maydis SCOH1-5]|uniref:Uncharacterized protein n=1 Tax=Cercospora zeae-maydis SCOH1-5 TaxID=717836 RepID=A0A6A6F2W6_9PEZI|nr:hypothetical protein CERZMDRAFT_115512 [Cercospora zeae-maydis SCOH1-5]